MGGDVHKMGGHLAALWLWSMEFAQDGDLSHPSDRAIAQAAGSSGVEKKFVGALIKTGFLDPDRKIHDWEMYAGGLIDRRKRDAARKRKERGDPKAGEKGREAIAANRAASMSGGVSGGVSGGDSSGYPAESPPRSGAERSGAEPSVDKRLASSSLREVLEGLNGYTPDPALEKALTDLAEELSDYLDVAEKLFGGLAPKLTDDPLTPENQRSRIRGYLEAAVKEARAAKAERDEEERRWNETPEEQSLRQGRDLHDHICPPGHQFEDCKRFAVYRSTR